MRDNKMLSIALSQIGIQEIKGEQDNVEVLKYFNEIGLNGSQLKDETSWCSAFINWCAMKAKLPYSGKLTARSWLTVGRKVDVPIMGDVVVFWRDKRSSWKGHVGLFIREANGLIYTLGGNQGNKVCIRAYSKSKVLGYRRINR